MGDVDVTPSATGHASVLAQYMDGANLRARASLYNYLEPSSTEPTDFGSWVLDHISWSGTETALDLGCGPGSAGNGLLKRAARVVGLDISSGMLKERRQHQARSPELQADAVQLPVREGSFDVVLAAHMLYHVSDVPATLIEVQRVLREGGALLAALNGATDKHEIRELWQEAASSVLGQGYQVSHWGVRANLDNMPGLFRRYFDSVTVERLPGQFRLPGAGPVLRWVASLRNGTEGVISDEQWGAVLAELERRVTRWVTEHRELVVTKDSGVIVAR